MQVEDQKTIQLGSKAEKMGIINIIVIPFILLIILLNTNLAYSVCSCLIAILLFIQRNNFRWEFTKVDLAIVAITILWILSPLWSICKTSAIRTMGLSIVLFGFYSLIRTTNSKRDRDRLINSTAIIFVFIESVAILTFLYHFKEAQNLNFTDMYSIRHLFHPLAETNNCWAQISLLGIAIGILSTRYKLVTTFLCSLGVLITFSRGAYLALGLIIILLCFWNFKVKHLKSSIAGIIIGITTISMIFPNEVSTVISTTTTESQQKSILWRKASSERAFNAFKSHPILGTGSRSFSLVCDSPNSVDSTYTNYPPNLLSEILVEKGIIGVLVYIWLLSLIIISIIRPGKNYTTALINSLIFIVLLKDMTQATLQNSLSSSIIFVFLLALGQLYQSDNTTIHIRNSSYPIFIGFAIVFTVFMPIEYFRTNHEKNTISAISELRKGDDAKTVNMLKKFSFSELYKYDSYPNLVLIGVLIQQNRYLEAQKIINSINLDSGYIKFYKGLLSIQSGDTITAITNFSRALCSMPSLVKCAEFQQLNPVIKTTILNSAMDAINIDTSNHNAIKGALLHYSGNHKKAEKYLKLALYKNNVLPIPYKLLGEKEKYKFLAYGAFHISSKNNSNEKSPKIIDLILHEYSPRYKIWYSIK